MQMLRLLKILFSLYTIFVLLFCVSLIQNDQFFRNLISSRVHSSGERRGFLVSTSGCQIADFDPFDASISHIYKAVGPLSCPGPSPLVSSNRSYLLLNKEEITKRFGDGQVQCGYKAIWREGEGESDDMYGIDNQSTVFSVPLQVTQEFLKIECERKKKSVFTEFLPFIQVKPEIEKKCDYNYEKWVKETMYIKERLNVAFVGIDSVSRLNMLRHMPETYNYLRNEMNAIELQGFTKVADNTFVNVLPLLTGLFAEECWNETLSNTSLHNLNFIWKNFTQRGYRTLFGEDYADIATFNVQKAGFWFQPTDYYLRPFNLALRDAGFLKNEDLDNCYNTRPEAEVTLQWLLDYLIIFQNKPTFSYLFNSRLSHNEINSIGYGDHTYYKFLRQLSNKSLLNNTLLIFFSDHGIRFGDIRDTYIGKVEERMPFFFLVFPPWFPTKYSKKWRNLITNQNRLTTFFDIHETLKEILNFTSQYQEGSEDQRGISLFSAISPERTCEDAAILPHWCTCHVRQSVPISNKKVQEAAKELIIVINRLISSHNKCAQLKLRKVIDSHVSGLSEKILRFKDSKRDVINRRVIYGERLDGISDYLITVLLEPSGGLFEGTVQYFEQSGIYKVTGDISRINKYNNQSNCIHISSLKKFCYCTE